jgi:hypothetical protein
MKDKYRSKFVSVVLQPQIDSQFWLQEHSDELIEMELLNSDFPSPDSVKNFLEKLTVLTVNKTRLIPVKQFAFGTETSRETRIPHYQIYLEFESLILVKSVYEELDKLLNFKVHIATQKVYTDTYADYCVKDSSNFEFQSKVYSKKKYNSGIIETNSIPSLVTLRPKLQMVMDNYFTGQRLLKNIAFSEPDDRTSIWLADVIGNTGKTVTFQTILDSSQGIYLRVSEGVERLSAKLRKKIQGRLERKQGYPKFIWVNFGRTVEEAALKSFSDFAEQILDGMLDDNFGNTSTMDYVPLPYVNLIVTANTPPNLRQLTDDRLKLLTLFPIYENIETKTLKDSLLIPIYVEIRVRVLKQFQNMLEYKFVIKLQDDDYIRTNFSKCSWYPELLENVEAYKKFSKTSDYVENYKHRLQTNWVSTPAYGLQSDIYNVYAKALMHTVTISSRSFYSEASSFQTVSPIAYSYDDYMAKQKLYSHKFGEMLPPSYFMNS